MAQVGNDHESILAEADSLINGDRAKTYGDFRENWQRTVNIFSQLTGIELTIKQALYFMVAVKLAREAHMSKRDNRVDTCGYLELIDKLTRLINHKMP